MLNLIGTVAVALAVSGGTSAEPPPPPYDWDGTPVAFEPFWAITNPGGTEITIYAIHPAEGRAVCAYDQQYAELGPLNCRVAPMQDELVFGPGGQL